MSTDDLARLQMEENWRNVNQVMELVRQEGDSTCERAFDFLLRRLLLARRVVDAASELQKAHEWAKQNPEQMLSSRMTSADAAGVMHHYFRKEAALWAALDAHDAGVGR